MWSKQHAAYYTLLKFNNIRVYNNTLLFFMIIIINSCNLRRMIANWSLLSYYVYNLSKVTLCWMLNKKQNMYKQNKRK